MPYQDTTSTEDELFPSFPFDLGRGWRVLSAVGGAAISLGSRFVQLQNDQWTALRDASTKLREEQASYRAARIDAWAEGAKAALTHQQRMAGHWRDLGAQMMRNHGKAIGLD